MKTTPEDFIRSIKYDLDSIIHFYRNAQRETVVMKRIKAIKAKIEKFEKDSKDENK